MRPQAAGIEIPCGHECNSASRYAGDTCGSVRLPVRDDDFMTPKTDKKGLGGTKCHLDPRKAVGKEPPWKCSGVSRRGFQEHRPAGRDRLQSANQGDRKVPQKYPKRA